MALTLDSYLYRDEYEAEFVRAFGLVYAGPIELNRSEVEEGRFFGLTEIDRQCYTGLFTPHFEHGYTRLRASLERLAT